MSHRALFSGGVLVGFVMCFITCKQTADVLLARIGVIATMFAALVASAFAFEFLLNRYIRFMWKRRQNEGKQ